MATSDVLYKTIKDIQESLQDEEDTGRGQPEPHMLETLSHIRYSMLRRDLTPSTTLAECLVHLEGQEIDTEQDPYLPGAIELLRRDVGNETQHDITDLTETFPEVFNQIDK